MVEKQIAQNSESVDCVLDHLKAPQCVGDYPAAATYGDHLSNALKGVPAIALERARIKMRQGYIQQAETLLDQVNTTVASPGERLIISMESASIQILRRLEITSALTLASAALEKFATAASASERAEAQRVYIRVLLNAAIYKELPMAEVLAQAAQLPDIADTLELAGLIDEGLSARFTYADYCLSGEAQLAALADVAERAERVGRSHIAGEAYVRRAQRRLAAGATEREQKDGEALSEANRILVDLDKAAQAYAKANHIIGPIDIQRIRAQIAIERELADSEGWIACLDAYRQIDYPKAEISLLMDLSQLAHDSGNTALALDYRQQSLALANKTGMGMAEDNFQLAWVDLLMRNNQYGAAIEICEAAIASDLPRFSRASYEQLLSTVYSFVHQLEKSMHHGRQAIKTFDALGAEGSATVAVLRLASDLNSLQTEAGWNEAEQLLTQWIAKDLTRGDSVDALQKQELLAQIYINQYVYLDRGNPRSPLISEKSLKEKLLEKAEKLLETAQALAQQLEKREQSKRLGAIYQLRGQIRQITGDFAGVEQTWQQALAVYEVAGMMMEAANCHYILGALRLNLANQQLLPHFGEAETHFNACLSFYDQAEMRKSAADTHFMFARLYTNAAQNPQAQHIQPAIREQMLQAALDHLSAGEFNYDAIRRDFYAGSVLEAQQSKQEIIRQSRRLYDLALEILLYLSPNVTVAWHWAQQAKARTLADTLGTTTVTPARILAQLTVHPASLALCHREQTLADQLAQALPSVKAQVRSQLTAIRAQMAQDQNLAEYLEIRTGMAFDLDDVKSTFPTDVDKQCVCIDWVEANGELWLFALRPGGIPEARRLEMRSETVQKFVSQNLSKTSFRATLRNDPEILAEMTPLVSVLESLTQPEELLIFSPTGSMYAIPLHALSVGGQILIERNPVVYCHSLNVLRHCLVRAKPAPVAGAMKTAAIFGDPAGDRPGAAELVIALGQLYNTNYFLNEQVTKAAFVTTLLGRDIVHFQGHAYHDISAPLDSYLSFADGQFTARDIFELRGLTSDIVTLGACESAANVIDIGDEPLGLIPSFLFAGSRSVLASLWKVNSSATAQFMLSFYQDLTNPDSVISKASALQRAMLSIQSNPEFAAPYYWAAFVLHGDWH